MYCQIIYAQQDEVMDEAEDILYDGGFPTVENIHEAAEYLAQWDYGYENEYDDALYDELERPRFDDSYYDDETGYTIITHRGLYISLWREAIDG